MTSAGQAASTVSPRLILTCLTIATIFTVCWTPLNISLLLVSGGIRYLVYVGMLRWLTVLATFNSCVNPVIYGVMWRPFRKALADVRICASATVCIFSDRPIFAARYTPQTRQQRISPGVIKD